MQIDYGDIDHMISDTLIPLRVDVPTAFADCPNCGGLKLVYAYRVRNGPHKSPAGVGSRWLTIDGKSGWYAGEMVPTSCPACAPGKKQDWLRARCGLNLADQQISISQFDHAGITADKEAAYQAAIRLLAQNDSAHGFATFHGGYGVGKSMLLKALVNGFRNVGLLSVYTTMSELLEDIRDRFGEDRGPAAVSEAIASTSNIRVLCIDEIDRINLTGWTKETAFRLVDDRYNRAHELVTVLATNLPPERLPAEFGYLASRMRGGLAVEVPGPDMRPAVRTWSD